MKTVQPWSEQSPPISLVWTSFRTPNCRLAWREHAGQIALPFDVLLRREKGVNRGERFSLLRRFGFAQEICRSLRPKEGAKWPGTSADPPLGNNDRGHSHDGGLDGRARGHSRSHGINGSVLEADLKHHEKPLH